MKRTKLMKRRRLMPYAAFVISGALIVIATPTVSAQTTGRSSSEQAASQDQQLAKQLDELRAQVARLQATLDKQGQTQPSPTGGMPPASTPGMRGGMEHMGTPDPNQASPASGMPATQNAPQTGMSMGMADMHKGEMGMAPDGMKMPGCMNCMMEGMGRMGGASSAATNSPTGSMSMPMPAPNTGSGAPGSQRSMSSLPGVPGASHLYHIGSTGFFLDQPHITLSSDQQSTLNRIKEKALLDRSNTERRIEQGEQELWTLTGADQPDASKIQAKAREIEQLRTNQRLAFIQSVGEATKVLTAEQRNHLLGMGSTPAK